MSLIIHSSLIYAVNGSEKRFCWLGGKIECIIFGGNIPLALPWIRKDFFCSWDCRKYIVCTLRHRKIFFHRIKRRKEIQLILCFFRSLSRMRNIQISADWLYFRGSSIISAHDVQRKDYFLHFIGGKIISIFSLADIILRKISDKIDLEDKKPPTFESLLSV